MSRKPGDLPYTDLMDEGELSSIYLNVQVVTFKMGKVSWQMPGDFFNVHFQMTTGRNYITLEREGNTNVQSLGNSMALIFSYKRAAIYLSGTELEK